MDSTVVNKATLLIKIRDNQATHEAVYNKAMEVYRLKVIESLTAKLAEAIEGKDIDHYVSWVRPDSHLDEYNLAIKMLEWEICDEITLSRQQFQQFVLDDWNWKAGFTNVCSGTYGITEEMVM